MTAEEIRERIKETIVEALEIEDLTPDAIDAEAPLFGEGGLGLDSIDALELGMAMRKKFGVVFSKDPAENRKIFASVKTLADHVAANAAG